MEHKFSTYRVEIKNLKYITDAGRRFPRTAIITFHDDRGKELATELFGNMETGEIYKLIHEGGDLNFDNCYIENLSLKSYRQHHNFDKKELVNLFNSEIKKQITII